MSRYLFFLSAYVLVAFSVQAQSYKPLVTKGNLYFADENQRIFAIKVDSQRVLNGDTIFYLNPNFQSTSLGINSSTCYQIHGKNWVGGPLVAKSTGNYYLFTKYGDTLKFPKSSNTSDTWEFLRSRKDSLVLTLTDIQHSSESVFGVMDSVKYLKVLTWNWNSQPINHDLNNKTIKLSKTHGLIEFFSGREVAKNWRADDEFSSPSSLVTLVGISFQNKGLQNLTWKNIHDYQAGDEIHTRTYQTYNNFVSTFWQRSDTTYTVYKIQSVWSNGDTNYYQRKILSKKIQLNRPYDPPSNPITITITRDLNKMDTLKTYSRHLLDSLSQEVSLESSNYKKITQIGVIGQMKKKISSLLYVQNSINSNCFNPLVYDGYTFFDGYNYQEKKGGPYYIEKNDFNEIINTSELIYWKIGNQIGGTPIESIILDQSVETYFSPSFIVYPNPSTGLVEIKTSEGEVNVYDIYMRKVASIWVNQTSQTADLSSLQPGLYWLESNGKKAKWVKE